MNKDTKNNLGNAVETLRNKISNIGRYDADWMLIGKQKRVCTLEKA